MAHLKGEQGKVKFIRKNGRIIPIRSKGGGTPKHLKGKEFVNRGGGRLMVERKADKRIISSAKRGKKKGKRIGATIGTIAGAALGAAGLKSVSSIQRLAKGGILAAAGMALGSSSGGRIGERKGLGKQLRKESKKKGTVFVRGRRK